MAEFQQSFTNYIQPAIAGDCAGKRFYPLTSAVAKDDALGVSITIGKFAWQVPNTGGSTGSPTILNVNILQASTNGLTNPLLAGLVVREKPSSNPSLGFGTISSVKISNGQSCQYTTQSVNEVVSIGLVSGTVGINSIVYASVTDGSIQLYQTAPALSVAVPTNFVVTYAFGTLTAGQLIQISNTSNISA
jgi:hypothetical protein